MADKILVSVKSQIIERYEPIEFPLKVYSVASLVCLVIDLITALVCLIIAAKKEWAVSMVYFTQLLVVTVYFYMDCAVLLTGVKMNF
jgi:hypothetical protein